MTVLVVGATGATGRLLVKQLLDRGLRVKVIVRSPDKLPGDVSSHANLSVIHANILEIHDQELARLVSDCAAVASCLGHVMSFTGIYGRPRRLVADATRKLCLAIQSSNPAQPTKFVLMNTAGNSNRDIPEHVSFGQSCVIWLLRALLPPHVDNEDAADFLRKRVGQSNKAIEWSAVRPDSLIDEAEVTEYSLHPSPTRSAIFNAGTTSRINVAHFMAELIVNNGIWHRWKGQMPVIYNTSACN